MNITCEDFPCCGHEQGDCPDPDAAARGEWPLRCVECGGRIKRGDEGRSESMHATCERAYLRSVDMDELGFDPDPDEDDF